AIETGCFILATARAGACGIDTPRYGHSLIVDPWGTILAEAEESKAIRHTYVGGTVFAKLGGGTGIITTELQAESLAEARARMRSIDHRVQGDSLPDPVSHKK
ncbi:MAG: nitrilase-related carbon-nitrogen hydrolase, partial [bacterium]